MEAAEGTAYNLRVIAISGVPKGFALKNSYSIKIRVDGEQLWVSSRVQKKGNEIEWKGKGCRHDLLLSPTSMLQVTLYRQRQGQKCDVEIGMISLAWKDWVSAKFSVPLGSDSAGQCKTTMVVTIRVEEQCKTGSTASPPLSAISAPVRIGTAEPPVDPHALKTMLQELLRTLDQFNQLMDSVTEVCPYTGMAGTIFNGALKLVDMHHRKDMKLHELIKRVNLTFEFVRTAANLSEDAGRVDVLSRLARQTVDCAYFISSVLQDTNFVKRLVKQSTAGVEGKILEYIQSFDELLLEFQTGCQVRMELCTNLILDDVRELACTLLLDHIPYVGGAGHEPSKICLGNTRKAFLKEIMDWAANTTANGSRVLALTGAVGTGKSTIAHTIASRFQEMKRLGAFFSFSSSASATRTPVSLMRNIARGLADRYPAYKLALCNEIKANMDLCTTEDLALQFETFIRKPATSLAINGNIVIVIDALDESGTPLQRRDLSLLLFQRLQLLPDNLRILITFREEIDIYSSLPADRTQVDVKRMPTPQQDTTLSSDIFLYIQHRLSRSNFGNLPSDITEHNCLQLASNSEGLFQWAFVACEYICGEAILGKSVSSRCSDLLHRRRGGNHLDSLYRAILEQIKTDEEQGATLMRSALGLVLATAEPLSMNALKDLAAIVRPDLRDHLENVLPFLGSLLTGVREDNVPIRPLHSSFRDFLLNPDRSQDYCINPFDEHPALATGTLALLHEKLRFNIAGFQSSYESNTGAFTLAQLRAKVPELLSYACAYWGYHAARCSVVDFVLPLMQDLLCGNFLSWLEASAVCGRLPEGTQALDDVCPLLQEVDVHLWRTAQDELGFIAGYAPLISAFSPHLYVSALTWCPIGSRIATQGNSTFHCLATVASGASKQWPTSRVMKTRRNISSLAYSPNGKHLVLGFESGSWETWNLQTGTPLGERVWGHDGGILAVAFFPDGKHIVTGSNREIARIWDVTSGVPVSKPLGCDDFRVSYMTFAPDGTRIVSASDGTVRIWAGTSGAPVGGPFQGHDGGIRCLALSPDGKHIVSGSQDNTVRIWDATSGAAVGEPFRGHHEAVTSVAFSPDGKHIVSGSWDRTVRIWNARSGAPVGGPLCGHEFRVTSVAFSPQGKHIASTDVDGIVRIWDERSLSPEENPLRTEDGYVSSVTVLRDETDIVAGSDMEAKWNVSGHVCRSDLSQGHTDGVRCVAFSPDGKYIVSASRDRTARIWDATSGAALGEPFRSHDSWVTSVEFSPDGLHIASGSYDGTVSIWEARSGAAVGNVIRGHRSIVNCVVFSPDGRHIAFGSEDGLVRVWDTLSDSLVGYLLRGHEDSVSSVAFSPDGRCIVSGSSDHTVRLWDTTSGAPIGEPLRGHESLVTSVAVSPDGKHLISGSYDKTVRIWDMTNRSAVGKPLRGHVSWISSVAFSPDGLYIVSGSRDKTVRVWDATSGGPVGKPLRGHNKWVTSVAFSPNGKCIASGSSDHTVRIWDVPWLEPVGAPSQGEAPWANGVIAGCSGKYTSSESVGNIDGVSDVCREPSNAEMLPEGDSAASKTRVDLPCSEVNALSAQRRNPPVYGEEARGRDERHALHAFEENPLCVYLDSHTLTLSNRKEHQMGQEYIPTTSDEPEITFNPETGWFMGNNIDHIFWVPDWARQRLFAPGCRLVIPGPMIEVDLSKFRHGTRWTECRGQVEESS